VSGRDGYGLSSYWGLSNDTFADGVLCFWFEGEVRFVCSDGILPKLYEESCISHVCVWVVRTPSGSVHSWEETGGWVMEVSAMVEGRTGSIGLCGG